MHNDNSLLINFKHDHSLYTTTRRKSLAFETIITQHNSIYGLKQHNNDATKMRCRIYTINFWLEPTQRRRHQRGLYSPPHCPTGLCRTLKPKNSRKWWYNTLDIKKKIPQKSDGLWMEFRTWPIAPNSDKLHMVYIFLAFSLSLFLWAPIYM